MKPFFAFEKALWSEARNVVLKPNVFTPRDAPVLRRGPPGDPDHHRAIAPSVCHDGRRFVMWYTGLALDGASSLKDFRTIRHSQCLATSHDGIRWTKPSLNINRRKRQGRANVLFEGHLLSGVDYLPERGLYVIANSFQNGGRLDGSQTALSVATSVDGLHWRGLKEAATDLRHFETCVGPKRIGNRYWVIGQTTSDYFKLADGSVCGRMACGYHSRDLAQWTLHPEPLFRYPVNPVFPRSCLQTHLGFTLWPRGRIHLGLVGQIWPACFSENVRFTAGLIYSYDGLNWIEPFEQRPVLGGPGFAAWHAGVIQGNSFYRQGELTYHWYSATDGQGNTWKAHSDIGLATIRHDGFAWFEGGGRQRGVLTTTPIRLDRQDAMLYVNAEARPEHPIRVDVLDAAGQRLPVPAGRVTADGVRQPVMDLRPCLEHARHVRFRFGWAPGAAGTRLYGFATGPASDTRFVESKPDATGG